MSRDLFDIPRAELLRMNGLDENIFNLGTTGMETGIVVVNQDEWRINERARKEARVNTPQNHQKVTEAEEAERARKRLDFHALRAIPRFLDEGWEQLDLGSEDKELRVYTTDYSTRTFWGIKPVGMGMMEFWEQNDPEVRRCEDNIAITWANPLVRPPVTARDELYPELWAGRGVNPDLLPAEPPVAEVPPATKAAQPRRHQKTPEVNPTHRVTKSKTPSPKTRKKSTRKSLANKADAGRSRAEDPIPQEQTTAPATNGPSQSEPAATTPGPQHGPATKVAGSAPLKRPRGRPANKGNPATKHNDASTPSKRTQDRPAKARPAAKGQDASLPKRSRGRPPGKGKATAVQGNARVAKPSQKERRALAPSTHGMRTRGKGPAELLQLP